MRIAIDATPLMKPKRSGVARYVEGLVRALSREARDEDFVLCYRLSRYSRREHRFFPPGPRFRMAWVQGRWHPRRVDVVHGPDGRIHAWRGAGAVVTLHDVFSLLTDAFASEGFREKKKRRYREIAERADRIICVSTWTRDRFLEHYEVEEERVRVVPLGVDDRFRPESEETVSAMRERHGIRGPYVLFVGQLGVRKNTSGMLDAWCELPDDGPHLVLAGGLGRRRTELEAEIRSRGLAERVVLTGYFPEEELPALLSGAECLLFPTLMEGFGLPALEAMACGIPVVSSDRGAMAETTAGLRVAVDPEDAGSIASGLRRLLEDGDLRADLARRGLEHAARFRWADVARRTLAVYREAVLDRT